MRIVPVVVQTLTKSAQYDGNIWQALVRVFASIFHARYPNILNRELQRLDDDVHWFCDRKDATKTSRSKRCVSGSEEDSQQSDMRLKTDSETRCLLVFDCLQLFAYENSELDPQKGFLAASIDRQLSKCEECVMIYYKRKRSNMEKLRQYDHHDSWAFLTSPGLRR